MSLQWTAVATFLYIEVFFVLLLCIPFISPKRLVPVFSRLSNPRLSLNMSVQCPYNQVYLIKKKKKVHISLW